MGAPDSNPTVPVRSSHAESAKSASDMDQQSIPIGMAIMNKIYVITVIRQDTMKWCASRNSQSAPKLKRVVEKEAFEDEFLDKLSERSEEILAMLTSTTLTQLINKEQQKILAEKIQAYRLK